MMNRKLVGVLGAIALMAAGATQAEAGHAYSVLDLGFPPSFTSRATGINASGQVVGSSGNDTYLYRDGVLENLGSLGTSYSYTHNINDSGQFVGARDGQGFVYDGGNVVDLGPETYAYEINNLGQVVGWSTDIDGFKRAFLYENGTITDLGLMGGQGSVAYAINDAGQITGEIQDEWGFGSVLRYEGGVATSLGTLGGSSGFGIDINESGQIVGASRTADEYLHAFLYSGAGLVDLGTLGGVYSEASGLNSLGHVVGFSATAMGPQRAFLYRDGAMLDLNDLIDPASGIELYSADGINDAGQIIARGYDSQGQTRVVMLTPNAAAVPEPSSVALAGLGLAALAAWRARRAGRES